MAAHINMGINMDMKAGLVWPSVPRPVSTRGLAGI
jgi:hypothetical protein